MEKQYKRNNNSILWILPSVILMLVIIVVPIFTVFKLSVSEISRVGVVKGYNDFENYKRIISSDTFWSALGNTLVWTIVVVGFSTIIGFILALVLNQRFRGRKIVRAILILPWATSLNIQALIWKYILNANYGSLNVIMEKVGLIKSYIPWLSDASSTFAWECWIGIFVTVPFVTYCLLSGLQSIDDEYYQAADVDGAGFWQKLFNITIPLLKPSIMISTVLNIIYVFNSFPIIWNISKGSPADQTHTLVTYLYKLAFYSGKTGEASAVSVIGFIILCIASGIYMLVSMRSEENE